LDLQTLIRLAYEEDLPAGDVTTDNLAVPAVRVNARLIAKEDLIVSGATLFEKCILYWDKQAELKWFFRDGETALKGQTVCLITAANQDLLRAERVALNFIGHLSGVASLTRSFVDAIEGTGCRILDTRKTMPLLRALEKKAVLDGGGSNHRMSLSDAVMIKDNHIDIAGSITAAVTSIRERTDLPIEVECSTLDQVKEAVRLQVHRIMLDNMSAEMMTESLKFIPKTIETEASGNMTMDRVRSVAQLGVDFISIGLITHSAPQADYSLRIDSERINGR
jgi:nicotinate-nucleotide pyrophosphorylase (carboxylating)